MASTSTSTSSTIPGEVGVEGSATNSSQAQEVNQSTASNDENVNTTTGLGGPQESTPSTSTSTSTSSTQIPSEDDSSRLVDPPNEPLARGMYELFLPVVREYDARVQALLQTQEQLSNQIDRFAAELNNFQTVSTTPPLRHTIERVRNAKERVNNINGNLTQILSRLERLERSVKTDPKKPKSILDIFQ